jgi:membrane peptidoglycan carboxypeptidase
MAQPSGRLLLPDARPPGDPPSRPRTTEADEPSRRPRRRLRRWLLGLLIAFVALVAAGFAFLAWLPGVGDASARVDGVLHEHGALRVKVPADARIARAVVAVEDHRFYDHPGVDMRSLARVGLALFNPGSPDQGGSTLDIQLAKRLYTGDRSDFWGKLQQVGLAVKLDRRWTKAQIVDMYVNGIYYGDGHWGVRSAARGYFGDSALRLDWGEASLLAGLPQAPSVYDPTRNFAAAARRQGHVLDRMVATGVLTRAEADRAAASTRRRARGLGFRTVSG